MQPMAVSSDMQQIAASGETRQNQCPEINNILLSDSIVNGGEQIRITIDAYDPDNHKLSYLWIAPRGQITGTGPAVVWTAPRCSEIDNTSGVYPISIEVSDGVCTVEEFVKLSILCDSVGRIAPETTILFKAGSTKVDNIAKAQLDQLALLLKQFPQETIILEGHTDNTGDEQQNRQVGLTRAESVKQYLVSRHSIDPNRMTLFSYGSTQPAAPNSTAAGRTQNRRVEIFRKF
jgi:flagellar motor protein MotB